MFMFDRLELTLSLERDELERTWDWCMREGWKQRLERLERSGAISDVRHPEHNFVASDHAVALMAELMYDQALLHGLSWDPCTECRSVTPTIHNCCLMCFKVKLYRKPLPLRCTCSCFLCREGMHGMCMTGAYPCHFTDWTVWDADDVVRLCREGWVTLPHSWAHDQRPWWDRRGARNPAV